MSSEEPQSGWLYQPAKQPLPNPATVPQRTPPPGRSADGRAEVDARLEHLFRSEAERVRPPGGTQSVDRGKDEAAQSGRPLAGDEADAREASGRGDLSRAEAGEVSPASEPIPRRQTVTLHPSGPTFAPTLKDDSRWRESYQQNEVHLLSTRVEELKQQLRRRTIMLAGAVGFGVLSATAAGLAVVLHFEPPQADQAPAATFFPEARLNPPQAAENSGPPPRFEPSPTPPANGAAAPEASAELPEVPRVEAPQHPVPRTDPLSAEPPATVTELGSLEDLAPASGELDSAAPPAGPVPVDPGPVGCSPDTTVGVAEEPLASGAPISPATPTMSPAQATAAAPAGRFAVYLFSVRPSTLVPSTWQRLTERYPELASLELRATRPVDVPGKGTFYAVEAGAFATRAEAQAVCDRLRPQGQSCKVLAP